MVYIFCCLKFQQGHTPAYYREHPQDIRHRTVQSRKPPPLPSKLIKSDPDSATSPSKYSPTGQVSDVALSANAKNARPDSSDNASESTIERGAKKKRKKFTKKKKQSNASGSAPTGGGTNNNEVFASKTPTSASGAPPGGAPPPPPTHGIAIAKSKQLEAENLFKSEKKVWQTENRDRLNLDIQKFVHKSKGSFALDDIKHAMDNAKILQRSESQSEDPREER